MKQVLTVFQYTFKEGIRKKAFWVSTIIIMALILLLCFVPKIMSAFEKQDEGGQEENGQTAVSVEKEGICYFIDETGIFEKNIEAFQALYPELEFQVSKTSELSILKEDVAKNEKNSILYIEEQEGVPFLHVVNTNFMKGINASNVAELSTKIWQSEFLTAQGVSAENIAAAQVPLGYAEEAAGKMNLTGYVLGLVMTFVMFFAVYYYGYGVAMSVASEKTSRVMETLIISAKPSRILVGKCLAMGAVGLLQLGGLLAFGLACYGILMPDGFQVNGIEISLSGFGAETILVLILYFILGYALYAVMNSVCGAAVSKIEDLNSVMMPVSVVAIVGFYLGYFTSVAGGGSNALSKLALYLPISSPFAVPFKILTGDITTPELFISMAILAVSIVIIAALSAQIYSASVMHYGNPLKWKEIRKNKANNR